MNRRANNDSNFSGAVLKRMIYWVRTRIVADPEGVAFVLIQVLLSLLREEDTTESLGIDYQEIRDIWHIANHSADEAECRRRLADYYRPKKLKNQGEAA